MQEELQLWYVLISGQADGATGILSNFYAYGRHCGEAIENALEAASKTEFLNPAATEATRLDDVEDYELPDDLIQLSDLVLTGDKNYTYPLDTDESFVPPVGIIKSTEEGPNSADLIEEKFLAYRDGDSQLYEFELVVGKARLLTTFFQALTFAPAPEQLEVCLKGHWHNQQSELWVNTHITTHPQAVDFLTENQTDLLENGYVECSTYTSVGETRLTLNEHKLIRLTTNEEPLFAAFVKQVMALGFEQTTELHSLEYNFYHWHYRPAHSLDAPDLRLLLLNSDFRCVKQWDEDKQ